MKHFLGRGLFGDVWEGLRNNEPVAVKFLQVMDQTKNRFVHFKKKLNKTTQKVDSATLANILDEIGLLR